jgi:hypothetical protein
MSDGSFIRNAETMFILLIYHSHLQTNCIAENMIKCGFHFYVGAIFSDGDNNAGLYMTLHTRFVAENSCLLIFRHKHNRIRCISRVPSGSGVKSGIGYCRTS